MEVLPRAQRPEGRIRLDGAMLEVPLLAADAPMGGDDVAPTARDGAPRPPTAQAPATPWQMGLATVKGGTEVLPVPFPTDELGFVLAGRVRLTELPPDLDPDIPLEDQATVAEVAQGDAFRLQRGDRVWMEVLEDLTFLYLRAPMPPPEAGCGGPPRAD